MVLAKYPLLLSPQAAKQPAGDSKLKLLTLDMANTMNYSNNKRGARLRQ